MKISLIFLRVMETPSQGGMAMMRNVARLIATYIRMHPEMNQALAQRSRLHEAYLQYHVHDDNRKCNCMIHYMSYCTKCSALSKNSVLWDCARCKQRFCSQNCADLKIRCPSRCCSICKSCSDTLTATVPVRKCAQPGCTAHVCLRKYMADCTNCKGRICEDHRRYCGYCGLALCGTCADEIGHLDCGRRKKLKPDE